MNVPNSFLTQTLTLCVQQNITRPWRLPCWVYISHFTCLTSLMSGSYNQCNYLTLLSLMGRMDLQSELERKDHVCTYTHTPRTLTLASPAQPLPDYDSHEHLPPENTFRGHGLQRCGLWYRDGLVSQEALESDNMADFLWSESPEFGLGAGLLN